MAFTWLTGFTVDGSVGIGTISPNAQIEIVSTSGSETGTVTDPATIRLSDNVPSATSTHDMVNPYAQIEFYSNDASQGGARVRAKIGSVYEEAYGIQTGLSFFTSTTTGAASEKMRINHDGKVGIGQTSPVSLLHVGNGSGIILSAGVNTWADTTVLSNGWTSGVGDWLDITVPSADDENGFIRLTGGGNVGIGTASPSSPLTIKSNSTSSSSSGLTIMDSSDTNAIFQLAEKSTDGGRFQMYDAGVQKIAFYTDGTDNYINAGNLGIGTSTPNEPLTVKTRTAAYFPGIKVEDYNDSMGFYIQNIEQSNTGIGTGRYYNSGSWRSDVSAPTSIRFDGGAMRFYAQSGVTIDDGTTAGNYTPTERMNIASTGSIKLNAYDSTNKTGTPTYLLGTDASGNIVKTNTIPGSAAGPYLPLVGGTLSGDLYLNDGVDASPSIYFKNQANNYWRLNTETDNSFSIKQGTTLKGSWTSTSLGLTTNLVLGSDTVQKDFKIYGNLTGEYLLYEGFTSKLRLYGTANNPALDVFTVSAAQPGYPQIRVGRDAAQWVGFYTTDRDGYIVTRQDETDAGTNTLNFDIWDSGTGIHTWNWNSADGSGASSINRMSLNKTGNLTVTGTITSGNITATNTVTATLNVISPNVITDDLLAKTAGGSVYVKNNGGANIARFNNSLSTDLYGSLAITAKGTSAATIASDGVSTLTTKSYVDGLVTGVPVYKGTWAAGTTGITSAAISGTVITLTAAPTNTIAVGDIVTADGIVGLTTTVTVVGSQTSVTVSASVTIAITETVTFSPAGGFPDLTSAALKILGNYYIVDTAGYATPNGASVEPDAWNVGDWAIFSDITPGVGTDLWQKIDNTSVLSGAGTGQKIAKWEGALNANSETLTDSIMTEGNGSIGINNPSPSSTYKLDVGGSIRSNTSAPAFVLLESDASNQQYAMFGLGGNFYVRDITGGTYPFKLEAGTPSDTLVLDSAGKVGIGTGNPAELLNVNKEDAESVVLISRGGTNPAASTDIGKIKFASDYSNVVTEYGHIKTYANSLSAVRGSMDFSVKSTSGTVLTGMTIHGTSAGVNVGIGTISPDAPLEIQLDPAQGSISRMLHIDHNPTGNQGSAYIEISSGSNNTAKTRIEQVSSGGTSLYGSYLDTNIINVATSASAHGNMNFITNAGIQMVIGGGTNAGNIKLNAYDSTNKTGTPTYLLGTDTSGNVVKTNTVPGSAAGPYLPLSGGTLTNTSAYPLKINRGLDVNVYGTNGAVVGIGSLDGTTYKPGSEIAGNLFSNGDDGSFMISTRKANVMTNAVTINSSQEVSLASELFVGGSGDSYFTGNLGIGATSPTEKLDVRGTGKFRGATYLGVTIAPSATGADMYFYEGNNPTIYLQSNGHTVFNAGNVGIGDTNPAKQLTLLATNPYLRLQESSASGKRLDLWVDPSSAIAYIGANQSAQQLSLQTGSSDRLFIKNDGSVGIGITTPKSLLEVEGTVEADAFGNRAVPTRIYAPNGATYNGSGTQTGYLIVNLPDNGANGINNMMTGLIRVYDYENDESFDVHFGGYWYSGYNWTNTSAWIDSDSGKDRNFPVRFGRNVAGTGPVITIGESNSTWSYIKFSVINFQASHSNYDLEKWDKGWSCAVSATWPGVIYVTKSNTQTNNWKRSGQDVYYGSGTGKVGIGTTSPMATLSLSTSTSQVLELDEDIASGSRVLSYDRGTALYRDLALEALNIKFNISGNEKMLIDSSGSIKFNAYDSTNNTGTPTYLLGTDASGNIVKTQPTDSGQQIYTLPATSGSMAWKLIGRFTVAQGGKSIFIKIVTNVGYNANIDQNYETYIRFKTSNGSSVDGNGFAADGSFYTIGSNTGSVVGDIKWVGNAAGTAATSYDLYFHMPAHSGSGSFYTVDIGSGTWANLGNAASDPGAVSSTIMIPIKQFKVGGSDLVVGAGGNNSYFGNGNLGVGQTNPGHKLDVLETNNGDTIRVSNTGTYGGTIAFAQGSGNTNIGYIGSIRAFEGNGTGDNGVGMYSRNRMSFYIASSTPAATITSSGNVGIGNTNNTYKLDVSGTIRATGDVIAYSDARVKENVETIENALDKVTQLRGVSYTRNDVEDKTTKIGVIAQEVLEVLPEVVQQDDEGKYSVAYGNMVGLLIEAIKEQDKKIERLEGLVELMLKNK